MDFEKLLVAIKAIMVDLAAKAAAENAEAYKAITERLDAVETDGADEAATAQAKEALTIAEALKARLADLEAGAQAFGKGGEPKKGWAQKAWEAGFGERVKKMDFPRISGDHRKEESHSHEIPSLTKETVITSELDALIDPFYRAGVVERTYSPTSVVSAIRRVFTPGKDVYKFKKETAAGHMGYVHTTLAADIAAADTTITLTLSKGIVVGTTIKVRDAAGTYYDSPEITAVDFDTGVVDFGANPFGDDILAAGADVYSMYFGATGESEQKPYGTMEYVDEEVNLRTLAQLMATTEQRINTVSNLQGMMESKMRTRAARNLAWHLLYGDGGNRQLLGFFSYASAQTYLWSSGQAGDTMADAIIRASLLINTMGTLSVTINRADWHNILLAKDGEGRYLHTNQGPVALINTPSVKAIGDILVRIDDAIKPSDFLLADHDEASEIVDQQSSSFAVGYVGDQFAKNEITLRYEETLAHAILSEEYFVLGNFDSQPPAAP